MQHLTPYAALAQASLELYVRTRRRLQPGEFKPERVPDDWSLPRACFVSLKCADGLRGCIGTIHPAEPTLEQEIIANAISAGTRDPRFPEVDESELAGLTYSVDVLSEPEPIPGLEGHDPRRYGLIVQAGPRRGLLLPDLEGIDTADVQEAVCRQKAGIGPREPVLYFRFSVSRYT